MDLNDDNNAGAVTKGVGYIQWVRGGPNKTTGMTTREDP